MTEFSAGGIVYRRKNKGQRSSTFSTLKTPQSLNDLRGSDSNGVEDEGKQTQWLVCKHSGYHKWVLPKGIVEQGESPEETAVREVREETGITARIIKTIEPDVRYTYRKNGILVRKRVAFYLMEYVSGDIADRSWEMEDARWVSSETALKTLAFVDERRMLTNAAKAVPR